MIAPRARCRVSAREFPPGADAARGNAAAIFCRLEKQLLSSTTAASYPAHRGHGGNTLAEQLYRQSHCEPAMAGTLPPGHETGVASIGASYGGEAMGARDHCRHASCT